MKMQKVWIVPVALATLVTGVALARGPHDLFEKADGNGDGKVTRKEAAELESTRFADIDADKDGFLTSEEMAAAFHRHHGDFKAKGAERFAKKDTNNDGKLTPDEVPRMPKEFFAKVDSNGDGALTAAEFEAFFESKAGEGHERKGPMAFADQDGDGKLSRAESQAMADGFFQRLDQNQDGVITKDEAKAAKRHHRGHRGDRSEHKSKRES